MFQKVTIKAKQKIPLLTTKTFGYMLGLSKRQIFKLNRSGEIPAPIRISGAFRWYEDEILEWLRAGAPNRKTWELQKGTKNG